MQGRPFHKIARRVLIVSLLFVAALLCLHTMNALRFATGVFDNSARNLIERSRRVRDVARPGYQDQALAKLPKNPNIGSFLRLDEMLRNAAVREKPSLPLQKDLAGIVYGLEFGDASRPNLISALGQSTIKVKDGIATIEQKNEDFFTNEMPFEVPRNELGEVVIRARANKPARMIVAWLEYSEFQAPSLQEKIWRKQVHLDLIADGDFHIYEVNLKDVIKRDLRSDQKIKRILLRPSLSDGVVVEIDFIRFYSTYARYLKQINGTDYEVVGNEMRKILYMLVPQALEYSLEVPEGSPFLDFGTAILVNNEPINFEISVESGQREAIVYSRTVSNSSMWYDARLPLEVWRGKKVKIILRVSGSQKNVALWSNPILYSEPERRFNVIIILEDALRADHLSGNGYKLPTTPVKDKLFAECGIVFENAISQGCWTRPSVPSLMTSLMPTVTGVWHFSDMLGDEFLTLAEIMRSQGFVTGAFIQNPNAGAWAGMHQGYSQLFDEAALGLETEGVFGERLKGWLESQRQRNFFLYLHLHHPAGPYDPPKPFDSWYRDAQSKGKPVERTYLDPEYVKQPTDEGRRLLYDGAIRHNDALLPKLIETLRTLGIYQDTLLVFMADHGEHLGERGLWSHGEPGYIETIHPQLNFVYPARFHASRRISQTVQLIDIMPTILDLARVDTSNLVFQGDSLLDLIEGRRLSYWDNRIAVSEEVDGMSSTQRTPRLSGSLFFRNWHLISSASLFKGSWRLPALFRLELFNFKDDHNESSPAVSFLPDIYIKYKYATVMTGLQKNDIEAWRKFTKEKRDTIHKLNPETQERLKALGYVK